MCVGLWARWSGAGGARESCTIIVTEPDEVVRPAPDGMPVPIAPGDHARWLDPGVDDPAVLQALLGASAARLNAHAPWARPSAALRDDDPAPTAAVG
ncbi:MAG: SOS response-associated peptidase [Gammaproteobacteria bacterium]|nr:SOS response-associated peptidase [Gammaproteobacteria bacterium]